MTGKKAAERAPIFRFFGGKGGVGKTTCAAATAVRRAEARSDARILVVSTDPAHSLGDALDLTLGPAPVRVRDVRGHLDALELDADAALATWLGDRRDAFRLIAQHGTYLDDEDIDRFLDLSLPGVDELVGLVELVRVARAGRYDEVVVDTAPTGHTLRLLEMPATLRRIGGVLDGMQGKHRFLAVSLGGAYRSDDGDRLAEEFEEEGRALEELLRDGARCSFSWVLLPETLPLAETEDALAALARAGIAVEELVVNRVTPLPAEPCASCAERRAAERVVIGAIERRWPERAVRYLAAVDEEPRGAGALRSFARALATRDRGESLVDRAVGDDDGSRRRSTRIAPRRRSASSRIAPPAWLDSLIPIGLRLVVFAGKGGVGKTTCAATAAIALAARDPGRRVLLLSTDPAHSLGDLLAAKIGDEETAIEGAPPNLRARELDGQQALSARRDRYRDAIDELFDAIGRYARFDASFDRAVLKDLIDLAPPGLDELFAILSLGDALAPTPATRAATPTTTSPPHDLVVLDTAPTGHALRLLAMPETAQRWVRALLAILLKYHDLVRLGELAQELMALAVQLRQLRALLADATVARAFAVVRAAELPARETLRLIAGLDELGVAVGGLVVNAVGTGSCRRCARAHDEEERQLAPLLRACARRPGCVMLGAPATFPPPSGPSALVEWGARWAQPASAPKLPTRSRSRRPSRRT